MPPPAPPTSASEPFGQLTRQMAKMMEQMQRGFSPFAPSDAWSPNVNLYETDKLYLVCVDLAGVEKEKIDLEVVDHRLKLRGHRQTPACPETERAAAQHRVRLHLMEIDHGPFHREVELPENVDHGKITARHDNGMLWVELPKKDKT